MATHYPIVFEREDSGVYSAYVAGLPVYAQGSTRAKTASAIVRTLSAYLKAHPQEHPRAEVRVAKVSTTRVAPDRR
jgi:predicted RNase H-like HicB family nuclease